MGIIKNYLQKRLTESPELPAKNSYTGANNFLKYGNQKSLLPDWSDVKMSDKDMYTGYSFAAINKRSNKVATIAKNYLSTEAKEFIIQSSKQQGNEVVHPYLKLIEDSEEFSEKQFWKNISTYLDLEGVYYLMAIRAMAVDNNGKKVYGSVKKFKLLNPYEIRRVINKDTGEVAGYVESKADGRHREIPAHMIIPIMELNPFNQELPYSIADAAQESQFTLKQAGDYARQSIQGNLNTPGALTTDVLLEDEQFDNFIMRMRLHGKGEPLYGNGAGSINWEDMQIDLDKAALNDINEINRQTLFAVSGTSKTILGIEESGTTRDTSQVQKETFTEDTIMPRIEDIIDALNLDYKKCYPEQYNRFGYYINLTNPLQSDKETELKEIEIRGNVLALAEDLISRGYDRESAIQYAQGKIELDSLTQSSATETETLDGSNSSEAELSEENQETSQSDEIQGTTEENQGILMAKLQNLSISEFPLVDETQLVNKNQMNPEQESTNMPAYENAHMTLVYGLKQNGNLIQDELSRIFEESGVRRVIVKNISYFDVDKGKVIVAKINPTVELNQLHDKLLELPHYEQRFDTYEPHMSLVYVKEDSNIDEWIDTYQKLVGKELEIQGLDFGNPPKDDDVENGLSNKFNVALNGKKLEDITNVEVLDHDNHTHNTIYDKIENALPQQAFDKSRLFATNLEKEVEELEYSVIEEVITKVQVNSFDKNDIIDKSSYDDFISRLTNLLANYWYAVMPIFANELMNQRNQEFGEINQFRFTNALKDAIRLNANVTATSHLDTILNDILSASNRALENVIENIASNLILEDYLLNPEDYSEYFTEEPSLDEIKSRIRNTDILKDFNEIYEKANTLALQGIGRNEIINAIRAEYQIIKRNRATTIARNETSRAFVQSQYESDLQFLKSINKLDVAYKQLYSRTGDPCRYCQHVIDEGPIPFEKNFLDKGQSITLNESGKVYHFVANYEDIEAGVLHVNCNCQYRLLFRTEDGSYSTEL